jgi:retron-type reverse transcriptase
MDAIKCITWSTQEHKKYFWIIEGEISSYCDTINHKKLLQLLARRIKDTKLLQLIWKFLRAGVMERKLFKDTKTGTPQGGILTPPTILLNVPENSSFVSPVSSSVRLMGRAFAESLCKPILRSTVL